MVVSIDIAKVASVLAQNDTAQRYQCSVTVSPEDMKSPIKLIHTPMEWYKLRYDYYFEILLESSE